jgi:hypothetical protein
MSTLSLEMVVREIAREEAAAAVRAALRGLPGSAPKYTTIAAHARRTGLGAATLRRWSKVVGLQRLPNGRYLTSDLDAVVARGGKPLPEAPPADLAAERARRAVQSMSPKGGRS